MEYLTLALEILGLSLMIFGLGAICGWLWAVKSLRVKAPVWITAVTAAAGATSVVAFALEGNWFSALTTGFLFATIVATQRQVGPFRRSDG